MKNKEKFANEILDIACKGQGVAMTMNTKRLCVCSIECKDCYFSKYIYPHNQGGCAKNLAHWANAEYKEPKKQFTEREKEFIKLFPAFQYIAKDKNRDVYVFTSKPVKRKEWWASTDGYGLLIHDCMALPFYGIRWEDEEPTSREEILGGSDE